MESMTDIDKSLLSYIVDHKICREKGSHLETNFIVSKISKLNF